MSKNIKKTKFYSWARLPYFLAFCVLMMQAISGATNTVYLTIYCSLGLLFCAMLLRFIDFYRRKAQELEENSGF